MRVRSLIVPFVAAAALLVGCTSGSPTTPQPTTNGVEDLEAQAIVDKAIAALDALDSYHVVGKGEDNGETVEVDVVFKGDDKKGTITAAGIHFDLLTVGGKSYFKGGDDLWGQFAPDDATLAILLPLVQGKWVEIPGSEGFDLEAKDILDPSGTLTKGDVTTVDGKKAITVKSSEGGELYVALEGDPLPLKIVDTEGTIVFTDINKDVTIEAPAASDIFDLSSFTG